MKKSLVITLAFVFVLGIAGAAFANPFTDVPANHWAYASVSKLAQAGIIDGYGDGRFVGNNTMTRYEMAQIVAKAMAKVDSADAAQRAQIEKLAAEFADELDSLGVRVAKLEKNADNVKITGEARFSWYSWDNDGGSEALRSRIFLSGQVNDKWTYGAMIQNDKDLRTNARDDGTEFRRAWVSGSLGDVNVMAGRFYYKPMYGTVLDQDGDGIKFAYSKNNFKFEAFALRPIFSNKALAQYDRDGGVAAGTSGGTLRNQVYGGLIGYDNRSLDATFAYFHTKNSGDDAKAVSIMDFAVGYRFDADWKIWGEYLRGSKNINEGGKSGWAAGIDYGSAKRSEAGTWSARARYYDVTASNFIDTVPEFDMGAKRAAGVTDGFKGWQLGATVMVAKNIDFNVDYFDFRSQTRNDGGDKYKNDLLWTYVRFYF